MLEEGLALLSICRLEQTGVHREQSLLTVPDSRIPIVI